MRYIGLILSFIYLSLDIHAGESYYFRVYLKDKGISDYTLENPEKYLSKEAIERRIRQGKDITVSDLPIASSYLNTLVAIGAIPVVQSRWLATVVVACKDSLSIQQVEKLSIVDSVKWVWKGDADKPYSTREEHSRIVQKDELLKSLYGYAEKQIRMLNGIKLHEAGFTGKGVRVAVIDDGFMNVDRIDAFHSLKLLGVRNIVFPGRSVFDENDHGTKVLSCLAANTPGKMIGTAPEASYWLIKSEDGRSEYPVEEDYWTAAVEFADSVGVDVVTTSLGYYTFDEESLDHTRSELDGKTAHITRAAAMAAEKGILLFCSAGNEGAGRWEKITFPSDAVDVLTVGSITEKKQKSSFSSIGFTADYRIKPDVVALGTSTCVINSEGHIRYANGTSFSTPVLAGLGICLWQALPHLTNKEIIELLKQVSSQYKRPDVELGYGIPDVYKAYKREKKYAAQAY